jgi:hypothetical protein
VFQQVDKCQICDEQHTIKPAFFIDKIFSDIVCGKQQKYGNKNKQPLLLGVLKVQGSNK